MNFVYVVNLYDSLIKHFREMRNCTDTTDPAGFHAFEQKAKCNSHVNADYCESHARKRVRKSMPDDGPASDLELTASDRFRTQVFYVILDKLLVEMERRKTAYNAVCRKFSFLTDRSLNSSQVRSSATNLVDAYKKDLDIEFVDEFVLFSELCGTEKSVSVSTMIQFMIEKKLNNCFPNVNIALRIYLSILGTSCESERSFSVLNRVKNYLRSTIGQKKLSALSLLNIESEVLRDVDTSDIIARFANKKCRKVSLLQ